MLINCNKNFRKAAYIPIAKARGISGDDSDKIREVRKWHIHTIFP